MHKAKVIITKTHILEGRHLNRFIKGTAIFLTAAALTLTILPNMAFAASAATTVGVQYKAHCQRVGWQNTVSSGTVAGTTDSIIGADVVCGRSLQTVNEGEYLILINAHIVPLSQSDAIDSTKQLSEGIYYVSSEDPDHDIPAGTYQ